MLFCHLGPDPLDLNFFLNPDIIVPWIRSLSISFKIANSQIKIAFFFKLNDFVSFFDFLWNFLLLFLYCRSVLKEAAADDKEVMKTISTA